MARFVRNSGVWAPLLVGCALLLVALWWFAARTPAADRPAARPVSSVESPGESTQPLSAAPRPAGPRSAPPPPTAPAPAVVAPSEATDTGSPLFDASDTGLYEAVWTLRPEITDCYNAWMATDGTFEGRLEVRMVVGEDTGADPWGEGDPQGIWPVSRVETLNDELHHPMVELCVKNAISGLEFLPRAAGSGVILEVPFSFRCEGASCARQRGR
jgi:hypothetical protein